MWLSRVINVPVHSKWCFPLSSTWCWVILKMERMYFLRHSVCVCVCQVVASWSWLKKSWSSVIAFVLTNKFWSWSWNKIEGFDLRLCLEVLVLVLADSTLPGPRWIQRLTWTDLVLSTYLKLLAHTYSFSYVHMTAFACLVVICLGHEFSKGPQLETSFIFINGNKRSK